ncbi:hypothetical protein KC19_1G037800 [Ceratodon purpureus]|uniref:Uncharacterized protein n=1 Tax=Ceratodon purpureus TaxID=3225 RepID=A0A8T0J4H1_CERPU|nr:hypothetical protein KC19_1G037800 [Ceratodon purpureus]
MVKFAQRLQAELVPEWQDAYCSYSDLKQDLTRIKQQRIMGPTFTRTGSLGLLKSLVSIKHHSGPLSGGPFSGPLSHGPRSGRRDHNIISFSPRGQSKDTLLVRKTRVGDDDVYVSELREPLTHSPQDRTFFVRLDAQLTKINKFYRKKEGEYIARAGVLEKQMLALINLEEDMARQGLTTIDYPISIPKDLEGTTDAMPLISEDIENSNNVYQMQTFPVQPSNEVHKDVDSEEDEEGVDNVIQDYIDQVAASNLKQRRASFKAETALEVDIPKYPRSGSLSLTAPGLQFPSPGGRNVRFSPVSSEDDQGSTPVPPAPRASALKKVSQIPEPKPEPKDEIEVVIQNPDIEDQKQQTSMMSQKELDHAKKLLRLGFVEFYRGLGLLSNFRSLNMTAFSKILKKYDKNTGWNFKPIYMKEVESSYFVTSMKVNKLMTKVEEIYTKHFTEGERKKAISHLRPIRKQGSHKTTFFTGLFAGCSLALFISFWFLVENKGALGRKTDENDPHAGAHEYLETVFPVFSTLLLAILHIYCYAFNVYAWARTRINYPFIFGFSPGSELRYRQVLLLATGLSTFLLGGMNLHIGVTLLINDPDPGSDPSAVGSPRMYADIIPLILLLTCLILLFLPVNLMYRSSRYFFLNCFRRLASTPFVKVVLADFFLGDQLTSQVLVFRNLEYVICYYPTGFFLTGDDKRCDDNNIYKGFGYVLALLPFWWRFLQCLRRYYDERDTHQLENAGKYLTAIVALGFRQAYSNHEDMKVFMWLGIIASVAATIYTSYWDLCIDWGLLNRNSKNRWLRDKIITKHTSIYFMAIGANIVLRLAWMLSIMRVDRAFGFDRYKNAFNVILACLEIIRRGIWNFFRIENEHLNNVGKYRAVKAVPLPFNDD